VERRPPLILGIETSCDDTACAVVDGDGRVLASVVSSQLAHLPYGGVVPEIASREHVRKMLPVMDRALRDAGITLDDVRAICVTAGPGLVGSLLVGVTTAKAVALARNLPLLGVNHLEGHVLSPFLENPELRPPVVVLVASGGHTLLVHVPNDETLDVIGRTRDDAAGEAWDKVSVLLGLGYPGGAALERLAEGADPSAFDFPRARLEEGTLDFSFSGLKTAVRLAIDRDPSLGQPPRARDVAASFQAALVDVLVEKTMAAAARTSARAVAIAGGVAANGALRNAMAAQCAERRLELTVPRLAYCGDNAAMIAFAGKRRLDRGERSGFDLDADPGLPLGAIPNRAPRGRHKGRAIRTRTV
jgi:N6-L-threonylcarbamoyladenine synthase